MAKVSVQNDNVGLAVAILIGSLAMMSFGDAVIIWAIKDLTMWQAFLLRSLFGLPIFFVIGMYFKRQLLPKNLHWAALRSVLILSTWICYYSAAPITGFALAAVGVYTFPVFIALITATILKHPVSYVQWAGILIGFIAVIAILNPSATGFSWISGVPILGGALFSVAMVLTRAKCQDEDPAALAVNLHGAFILFGFLGITTLWLLGLTEKTVALYPFLLETWSHVDGQSLLLMGFLGLLAVFYFLGVAKSYQIAPPQIMAVFDYSYLGFAVLWGYLFFGETIDLRMGLGIAMIVVGGVLAVRSPRQTAP